MATLQPAEYLDLKEFLRFFSERFFNLGRVAPHLRPLAVLETTERDAPARASSGLRMAINDCVEMSSHWPLVHVSSLDAELQAKGVITLSQVRQRYWGRYAAVLKRDRLRNEGEYILVRGVLDDRALTLETHERAQLQSMTSAYEGQRPDPPPRRTAGRGR